MDNSKRDPPPDYDLSERQQQMAMAKKMEMEQIRYSAPSIISDPAIPTLHDDGTFHPSRSLRIHAHGIGLIRLPLPSGESEIPVYNTDGSLAYLSKRRRRFSGDAVLSHPKLGQLVSTSYFFGPNNDPIIRLLQAPDPEATAIRVSGRRTSRSTSFVTPLGRAFEWSYAKRRDARGRKVNLLVLKRTDGDAGRGRGKVIAQLVRGDETRTPGSSRSSAGNGGELLLDRDAGEALDEVLIVATCLLMLKREIDRRRMLQTAVIAAAVSGA